MNTLALDQYHLPDLQNGPAYHFVAESRALEVPWGPFRSSSGAIRVVPHWINPASGLTYWLESVLGTSERPTAFELTTPDVPGALVEIRDAFSLSTVQLAEVLGVSRQAIYDWSSGRTVKLENRQRIGQILEFVGTWMELHPGPMGPVVAEAVDGSSLFDLLCADALDSHTISAHLSILAGRLEEIRFERPSSARELAARHGMRPLSEENQRRNLQTARLRVRRHG
ncbi:MAG: helix-turn-helix transcriptional regulator [Verrucomicrobiae bacterium]|nr:helix-turn-helix transcriptional regulator [Verrucomicrobiae bacterium]